MTARQAQFDIPTQAATQIQNHGAAICSMGSDSGTGEGVSLAQLPLAAVAAEWWRTPASGPRGPMRQAHRRVPAPVIERSQRGALQ